MKEIAALMLCKIGGKSGSADDIKAVIEAAGESHPVVTQYRGDGLDGVGPAVVHALDEQDGDVLVFLPGAAEIRAAERDLSWGLARAGRFNEALAAAAEIATPREQVHAYSRIALLTLNSGAAAPSRYL